MLNSWRAVAAPSRLRIVALILGVSAGVAMIVVGCTSVTSGTVTVDPAEAPVYKASVSASIAESAESSSSRESERQESITKQAVHSSCEALSSTSADAIGAVNAYVGAYNDSSDIGAKAGPAIDSLNRSADEVSGSLSEPLGPDLTAALTGWVDAARAVATAIAADAAPGPFNDAIRHLNDTRSSALDLCDAAY